MGRTKGAWGKGRTVPGQVGLESVTPVFNDYLLTEVRYKDDADEWDDGLGPTVVIPPIFPTKPPDRRHKVRMPIDDDDTTAKVVGKEGLEDLPATLDPNAIIKLPAINGELVARQLVAGRFEPGSNQQMAAMLIATREIAKSANRNDVQSLEDCFDAYLYLCINAGVRVTNMSAYAACGVTRTDIDTWASGSGRGADPRYRDFAIKVKVACADYREQLLANGYMNPVLGIWWQKVYEHYSETMPGAVDEVRATDGQDARSLARKYKDIIVDD